MSLLAGLLLAAGSSSPVLAAASCVPERLPAGARQLGPWVDAGNWRSAGNLRVGPRAPQVFLPGLSVAADPAASDFPPAAQPLDLDQLTLSDPVDAERRSVASLLDTRLYAESLIVLYNGRLFAERNWHSARSDAPRLLQDAGRPLLSLLGVMSVAQGKLAAERSVVRYLPLLAGDAGLRRLSVQRLLEGEARFDWTAAEVEGWQQAAGWSVATGQPAAAAAGVRDWLRQPQRWDAPLREQLPPSAEGGPDDDLLAWLLAESHGQPLARVFCEQIVSRLRPAQPVSWLTDGAGHELAGGLVMSLQDFARFGQLLIEARVSPNRSRIPAWFIEALTAPAAGKGEDARLAGLRKGAEMRYGFIRLAGSGSRIAIAGAHGSSLYVDFDRRLVVALHAAHPARHSPLQRAAQEQLWERLSAAMPLPGKR
jgi:hypothetical protein